MEDGLFLEDEHRGNVGNLAMAGVGGLEMGIGMEIGRTGMGASMENQMENQHRLMHQQHQPQLQPHVISRPPSHPHSQPEPPAQQQFPFDQHQQASDQLPRQLQTPVPMDQFGPPFFSPSDPYAGSPYASPAGGGSSFPDFQYELGSDHTDSGVFPGPGSPFDGTVPVPLGPGPLSDIGHFWGTEPQAQPLQHQSLQDNTRTLNAIDEFFIKNGAHRPPVPCSYCKRQRLQCLILQTTEANPNPVSSCSSCVALYRDCSLAERSKRDPNAYETVLPVIGHLHGVCEEVDDATTREGTTQWRIERETAPTATRSSSVSHKRNSTRSVKKTRVLRNWFATHQEHPYPSEDEKSMLSEQSGLSKTQVINWFANARRRHRLTAQSHFNNSSKVFLQGSPMPQTFLSGMSPMERWRHSPPNEEPVSVSAIENAISNHVDEGDAYLYSFDGNYATDGAPSSASSESAIFNQHPTGRYEGSSNSGSSAFSFYQSDDAGIFNLSAHSSINGGDSDLIAGSSNARTAVGATAERGKAHMFQCTFCRQSFKKKYDWVRHERSIHLPGLDSWICKVPLPEEQSHLVWRVNHSEPECIFCGQASPTEEHLQAHEFQSCAERPVSERTFTRKDHLWQHLHKFHRCRKWDGWKPNLHLLQHRQDKYESVCGFCQLKMHSWDERVQHLASHFRRGTTMVEWTGAATSITGDGTRKMPSNRARTTPLSGDEADASSLGLFP
ncbi:C2H2 transcriptional regulator [Trichoderma simmonsii]|uniref:C2H2 transcriptional regulator n=1 Tax=Trichoderma simmonsii TaxID=1491479 RepID=A0A8G0L5V7_9HYPO|nr:C2H2 transcriptional regulator [Trichoderma simmonsii]